MYMSYGKLCLSELSLVLQIFNKDSTFYRGIFIFVLAECTEINAVVEWTDPLTGKCLENYVLITNRQRRHLECKT